MITSFKNQTHYLLYYSDFPNNWEKGGKFADKQTSVPSILDGNYCALPHIFVRALDDRVYNCVSIF